MVRWGRYYSVRRRVKWPQYVSSNGRRFNCQLARMDWRPQHQVDLETWDLRPETWDLRLAIALTLLRPVPILRHLRKR